MSGTSYLPRLTSLNAMTCNQNFNPKPSYALFLNNASILNLSALPQPHKSFLDAITGSASLIVLVMLTLLHCGELIVLFSAKKVKDMVKRFKLGLVGKVFILSFLYRCY